MSEKKSHVFSMFMNKKHPSITHGEGVYFYDEEGKRYLDASGGPILCNLGHGNDALAEALHHQAKKIAFVFRHDFTTPILEEASDKLHQMSDGVLDRIFFVSGGTEAVEIGVKIARKYHIDNGRPSRFKVISRWQSYHGSTMGALSWTGFTSRRAEFTPYLQDHAHIPPAYCYRCWYGRTPDTCGLECAQALENEIMCLGPESVAVFLAEPISGMSLCGAVPHPDYFPRIREICDQHGVLLMLDEVMTGCGRTGRMFAYEHFNIRPDIIALGKGLGGGYFPIGAAAVSAEVADTIARRSGFFGAGHSWAGNPMGAAVVAKTLDYMVEHNLVERSARMGRLLKDKLLSLADHPHVGDIRGEGLMVGVEFVADKTTKKPFPMDVGFAGWVAGECLKRGMFLEASSGCDRGQAGDAVLFGPPFIIDESQLDEVVAILAEVLALDPTAGSEGQKSF